VSGDQKVQYILEVNKMRIIVIPERLDDLSRQMTQATSELRDLEGRLGRALGGLDWQVRQQANVEGQVHSARRQALALADEAGRLARFLTDRAAAFRQADAEGAQALGDAVRPYIIPPVPVPAPTPTPEPEGTPISLPSLDTVFDVLKASLSTISLFVTSLGLDAVKVFAGAADFFLRKLPNAEAAFRRWEEYNQQDNWDRATAAQYQEEARKALEGLGIGGLKDTLDLIADKIPRSDVIDEALKKAYDAVNAVAEWIEALGER
jgi:uncharacterized protein YukE